MWTVAMIEETTELADPAGRAGSDRRASPRVACAAGTCCYWLNPQTGEEELVGIRDLSLGGVGLLLPQLFATGTELRLRMGHNQRQVIRFVRIARVVSEPVCLPNDTWLHGSQFDRPLEAEEMELLL